MILLFAIIQRVYYIMFIIQNIEILQQAGTIILQAIGELMIQTQISPCYACSCFLKSNLIHILIDNSKISRAIVQHFVINSVLI